ncbi:uncharacterized protein LY89DRAFT_685170 [Mollisia scopiformis]|uniref:Uncharacterized protein n=1 Tax=Mollisia scopiformis TaxID=149040 RepID=A0A194X7Q0_MOLSC|nr:uncharacterized protein LY89DRAFT_685170 [Mollisia scopiformis]KUJ16129.1 hypothetical protein LY89DRAFT_685170 [Mollisia scopiformis]
MNTLRLSATRGARCIRRSTFSSLRASSYLPKQTTLRPQLQSSLRTGTFSKHVARRQYSTKSSADSLIEDIQEQYATARDEFEIAAEETEKKSVYAADDRAAAREELDKLKSMYEEALRGADGEEIKSRVGQRIRELDSAVQAMEKSAMED